MSDTNHHGPSDTNVATSVAVLLFLVAVTYTLVKYIFRSTNAVDALKSMKVKIVTSSTDCDLVVEKMYRECKHHRALGFDCEWVTEEGKRNPVALVQLSNLSGFCGLFRLCHMKEMPKSLKYLLEDESIYKLGVAPGGDAKYLNEDYGAVLKSSLDLRHLAELCGYDPGGLASLSKSILGIILDKSWRVRCSDWEAEELSTRQINYAAADAHVAVRIFDRLLNQYYRSGIRSLLPLSASKDAWTNAPQLFWKYLDVDFKTHKAVKLKAGSLNKSPKTGKERTVSKRYPNSTRTKPLYHNCFLEAPDGDLLCTVDNQKALWYVEKQLADVVKEEPLTVRLRFQPSGRAVGDVGRYYQMVKENKCVVCGSRNTYIRKNVVPREYRKYFPEMMKEHSSHDVLLLCATCHQRSNVRDQAVRERLAAQCGAPLAARGYAKYSEDADCRRIRSASRALLSTKHTVPEARRRHLEALLLQAFPQYAEVTPELLHKAASVDYLLENAEYESHGLKVTEYFMRQEGGLLRLEREWREHFLASMRPRHMPPLWSVAHNEERLRVKLQDGRLTLEDLKAVGDTRWL